MNVLAIVLIVVCSIALEFLMNYMFTKARLDALAELGCMALTLAILSIGYHHGEWLLAIYVLATVLVRKVRHLNRGKE
ncbi:hypothetical protein ABH521_003565 [Staphylococcus warneri]|uniref:hypothetical protein n=1 Tax=Staphylococcus warneri TaxID=1292 RepID=UPI0032610B6E